MTVRIRVGIIVLPTRPWPQQRERWRRAESYGFDHGWTYDHLGWDPLAALPWGATMPTLLAAASVTERISLGTWVATPNFRHPASFAYELAALDDVSGGRAVLGVGAGGTGGDSRGLGQPELAPAERAGRLEEFLEVVDAVLTTKVTDYQGAHYTAASVRRPLLNPEPTSARPRLPFVIAANGPRLMRAALRHGSAWATSGAPTVTRDDGDAAWWQGVAHVVARFDDMAAAAGRADLPRMLSLDSAQTFALTSIEAFRDGVGRAAALGFTDVVVHWPEPGAARYDAPESVLDEVGAELAGR